MRNSAVANLSEVSAGQSTSCQMQMPHSDLTSSSYKVHFIISACVALWNACALILTLDLLLNLRMVKICSARKWEILLAMSSFRCMHDLKHQLRTLPALQAEMILMRLLQETKIRRR